MLLAGLFALPIPGAGQVVGVPAPANPARVAFTLKNSLGYHRMFRVEGPGIAYGFTMGRRETVPCNWPIGAKLYFSPDGETTTGHILTVAADDAGKTLSTGDSDPTRKTANQATQRSTKPVERGIPVRFQNNSFSVRRVALITYKPGETGNGTRIFPMMPFATTKEVYPVGTKVYFADDRQVDIVMSGRPLTDKPFLTVKAEDAGKTYKLLP